MNGRIKNKRNKNQVLAATYYCLLTHVRNFKLRA